MESNEPMVKYPVIGQVIKAFVILLILFCIVILFRQFFREEPAQLVSLNICSGARSAEETTDIFSPSGGYLFLCGEMSDGRQRPVNFIIRSNDEFLYDMSETLETGEFFIQIPHTQVVGRYVPGEYTVKAYYTREVVKETSYVIEE